MQAEIIEGLIKDKERLSEELTQLKSDIKLECLSLYKSIKQDEAPSDWKLILSDLKNAIVAQL